MSLKPHFVSATSTLRLLFCLCLLSGAKPALSQLRPLDEFRGMWVITWEIFRDEKGVLLTGEKLKARIDHILDNVQKGGLTSVLWQVRQGGTVYFPSKLEPWGKWTKYISPGFDPLAYAIKAAHARRLEFHAWINTFETSDNVAGAPVQQHPEWVCRDKNGVSMPKRFALSPGLPQARRHIQSVIMEVAANYDVDGIHLDYIRWSEFPMGESDYPPSALPQYQYDFEHSAAAGVPTGFADWNEWRRAMVTTFMRELRLKLSGLSRKVILSVAAIGKYNWGGWNGYHFVHQDAALWFNKGIIDHLMPMNYAARTPEKLTADLAGNCPSCWHEHIGEGLSEGRKFSVGVGSYMLHNQDMWHNHPLLLDVARAHEWVSGVQFFSYGDWEKQQYFEQAPDILWR